jgi:hypothetical protein
MYQFGTVARLFTTKFGETAKCLVVRVAFELQHYNFVAEVFQLFDDQQPHHQPDGFGRSAQALAVMFGEGLIQFVPWNHVGKTEQRIVGIELLQQIDAK